MPLEQCSDNGKKGWRWGSTGKCYTGPGARKKAIRQGLAIEGPEKFREMVGKAGLVSDEEIDEAVEHLLVLGLDEEAFDDPYLDAARAYISQKERDRMPGEDFGWPEQKKFPVKDQAHLDAAFRLLGRAPRDKQASIRRRLIQIARRKGLKLPSSVEEET